VVQRYEVMMTFFYLSTLYCVARGMSESGGGTGWNLAAILTCWLGMGCKEVMITAPVGVVLYHLAFRKEVSTMPLRGRWWLYLGLAVGWGMLVVLMRIKVRHDLSRYYVWPGFSPVLYVLTAPKVLWRYLWLSVFPKDLCFDYAWPVPNRVGIPDFLGCVAVMGVTVFFVYEILRHKPWAFPPTLALLVLAPTMLIPRPDPVVEYRMYLPLAAVLCTAVVALYQVFRRIVVHYGHGMLRVWVRGFGWLVFVGIIVWFSFMTLARNCDYHSAERLWRGVIRLRPENLRARVALGSVLLQEGRVREAEECFRDVIRLSESKVGEGPSVAMTARAFALKELAMILHRRGQSREAATLLREALRIAPDFVDARKSLAFVEGQEVEEREEK
ncbi:MAG: tetratricopeptide repeat protein, partial [Kiritimatiellae bacterium]|nr:tetratricopeptide repeat protein [Kiritimatiellia bacterium]